MPIPANNKKIVCVCYFFQEGLDERVLTAHNLDGRQRVYCWTSIFSWRYCDKQSKVGHSVAILSGNKPSIPQGRISKSRLTDKANGCIEKVD